MKSPHWVVVILAVVGCLQAVASADEPAVLQRPALYGGESSSSISLGVDPVTGRIWSLDTPGEATDGNINSIFAQISAVCVDCPGPCPPESRQVDLIVQANSSVPDGWGVGNLTVGHGTVTFVTAPPKGAGNPGDLFRITVVVDLISCPTFFSVYLDLCSPAPLDPTQPCP